MATIKDLEREGLRSSHADATLLKPQHFDKVNLEATLLPSPESIAQPDLLNQNLHHV